MDLGHGLGHLTYSTLVHPADNVGAAVGQLADLRPQGESAGLAPRALRRLHPPGRADRGPADRRRGGAPAAHAVPRRPGPVCLYGQRVPVWRLQRHGGEGAGLRARLADRGAHAVHDAGGRHSRRDRDAGGAPVHPDRAARVQAERHGPGRRGQLHRARAAGGRAPGPARGAHRPAGDAGDRARAALLSRNDDGNRRRTSPTTCIPARRPRGSRRSAACRSPRRTARCGATSASCSISAIRRSASRTSPPRCSSWSTPAFRFSSCRKSRRCTSPW